ncbi:MAG TPA: winged helix-turn-helix transcriptional regulator [Solirubrobacterales bacterium]|nr:winged helix-turn-helix transcriptional regulator [Solirubrobacterales bacterium]
MTRAGTEPLSLLAAPLHLHMLKALQQGPLEPLDLHRAVGSPPQSTMRVYSRRLEKLGLLERRRRSELQAATQYRSTPAGESLLGVAAYLQEWLGEAPDGPIMLGSIAAKSATKALIGGWSSNIVRAVAARPLSLTDLNKLILRISYPSLERKLIAMRIAKMVEPQPGDSRGTPYRATEWLHRAVVPLTAAAAWELKYIQLPAAAISRTDIEAVFLLAVPLMSLDSQVTGRFRFSVELRGGTTPTHAGVLVHVEKGRVVSCSTSLEGEAQTSISGSPMDWMRQMNGGPRGQLEISGNRSVAQRLLDALRATPKSLVLEMG